MWGLKSISTVGVRTYSSQVTHDFLNSILARAQEATAKNKEVVQANHARAPLRNRTRQQDGGQQRPANKIRQRNGKVQAKFQVRDENSNRAIPDLKTKQPQFKRAQRNNRDGQADVLDVMDAGTGKTNRASMSAKRSNKFTKRGKGSHVIEAVSLFKKPTSAREIALKKSVDSVSYEPVEPTPLSLLAYSTPIFNTHKSNILQISMQTIKNAASPKNTPSGFDAIHSGIMNKERVLNSSQLDVDVDRLKQIARGQYFSLPVLQNKAFDSLTKSEDKKKQLVENSNVVRRSLDSLDIEPEKKEILYAVCSGTQPVSEVSQLSQ